MRRTQRARANAVIRAVFALVLWAQLGISNEFFGVKCPKSVLFSFVGDVVLGDYLGASGAIFSAKFAEKNGDFAYFSRGVREIFARDDLSIANLEGVLSDEILAPMEKKFVFKGAAQYAKILKAARIEAVNLANNHTRDYGAEGFISTQRALDSHNIAHFGEGKLRLFNFKGVNFGFAGSRGWHKSAKSAISRDIQKLRARGANIVILSVHWGDEGAFLPNSLQRELAHFAIDSGADLVIGHHPHTLQGFEDYKGKKIAYSLGNFIFGGAKNPRDKDSVIYQVEFRFMDLGEDKSANACEARDFGAFLEAIPSIDSWQNETLGRIIVEHRVIPASISHRADFNDYAPRVFAREGDDFARVMRRLNAYSEILGFLSEMAY